MIKAQAYLGSKQRHTAPVPCYNMPLVQLQGRGQSTPRLRERTRRVYYEQPRQLQVEVAALAQAVGAALDGVARDIGCAYLLRDAAGLALLHIAAPHIVQQLGLACATCAPQPELQSACGAACLRRLMHARQLCR